MSYSFALDCNRTCLYARVSLHKGARRKAGGSTTLLSPFLDVCLGSPPSPSFSLASTQWRTALQLLAAANAAATQTSGRWRGGRRDNADNSSGAIHVDSVDDDDDSLLAASPLPAAWATIVALLRALFGVFLAILMVGADTVLPLIGVDTTAAVAAATGAVPLPLQGSLSATDSDTLVRALAWHPYRMRFAVGTGDGAVRIYDVESESWSAVLEHEFQTDISVLSWSPSSGGMLAVGSRHGICLWTVAGGAAPSDTRGSRGRFQVGGGCVYLVTQFFSVFVFWYFFVVFFLLFVCLLLLFSFYFGRCGLLPYCFVKSV